MDTNALEKFWNQLPGVGAYRAKETRREVDKRIRQQLMEELEHIRVAVSEIQRTVLRERGLRWMNDLERIHSRLTLLIDKVRSAAYGYRPLFDLDQVKEEELEALIRFDKELLARLPQVEARIQQVRNTSPQEPEIFEKALHALYDAITDLLMTYDKRDALVRRTQ